MAPEAKSSNGFFAHARDTGLRDELKKSSLVQQSSKKTNERLLSPRGTETIKYPDKRKTENHLAPSFIHQHREQRQFIDARAFHQKAFEIRPGRSLWGKGTANDELIKHMSNLPAYLQRINRGDNFQENVLNVGVLDWTRLEKWNLNQKGDVKRGGIVTSSSTSGYKSSSIRSGSSSLPTALPIKTSTPRRGVKAPLNSHLSSSHIDGPSQYQKPASSKFTRSQDSVSVPEIFLDRDKKILPANSSSRRNSAQVAVCQREKRKGLNQETDLNKRKSPAPVKGAIEPCKANIQKSDRERRNVSDAGTSSFSTSARRGEQVGPFDGEIREREGKREESGIEVSHLPRHRKAKSTVLPLPKRFPQSSIPHMLKKNERTIPSDPCFTEPSWSSFSDSFSSGDLHSGVLFSDIPRSCPLPSQVEIQNETVSPTVEHTSHAPSTSSGELHSFPSLKYAKRHGLNSGAASVDLTADMKIESRESPESEARRSRNPSPNRRFSFSLGRMARSFSFKETASVPRLGPTYISAKSGPVTNHDSSCGTSNQEKANPSNRARSSPLRRLLDPLLKSKSISSHHAAENIQLDKLVSNPLLRGKHEKFTIEALLQLTVKNGNPFFKFVVDNNSDVLAASVSNSVSARKNGSFRSCTFYSVNEIKKKSIGWIGQGNKTKGEGFAYNVVGQMKLSNSPFCDWTLESLNQQVITTECVLFGIDSRLMDKQPENFIPNSELAAIVFKFSASPNENEGPNSVTVILPGGVHGLPKKGEPSPLINRWILGGSCDCGGWDIGCKLHVLSNKNYCRKNTEASKTCSTWDHLELFAEGQAQSGRPVFSLTPFRKGIHSVEFDSSISPLQAFSICIAFLSCQGYPDSPEANCLSERNALQEPILGRNAALKAPMIFQREGPAKYAPCPPLSPVGRV